MSKWINFLRKYGPVPRNDNMYDETIQRAAYHGYRGIVFEAGRTLLIDPQKVAETADEAKIFVIGIETSSKT